MRSTVRETFCKNIEIEFKTYQKWVNPLKIGNREFSLFQYFYLMHNIEESKKKCMNNPILTLGNPYQKNNKVKIAPKNLRRFYSKLSWRES